MLYNIACAYSLLGMTDEALSSLESAVDRGFGHKEWIEHDTDLDPIRETPRFQAIAQAKAWGQKLEADNGTEILPALDAVPGMTPTTILTSGPPLRLVPMQIVTAHAERTPSSATS